jgi:hypothetical protein
VHIDQAKASVGVLTREQDRVGVAHQPKVGQVGVGIGPRHHESSLGIIGRNRREGQSGDRVLVHGAVAVVVCRSFVETRTLDLTFDLVFEDETIAEWQRSVTGHRTSTAG